jgi:hypothetical protein
MNRIHQESLGTRVVVVLEGLNNQAKICHDDNAASGNGA